MSLDLKAIEKSSKNTVKVLTVLKENNVNFEDLMDFITVFLSWLMRKDMNIFRKLLLNSMILVELGEVDSNA